MPATHQYISPEALPLELRDFPAFLLWKWEERNGKLTKVPYSPTGERGSHSDARTWTMFETANATPGYDGIGFVFSTGDPYFGLDLDSAFSEDGTLKPWAAEIVQIFTGKAYIEYSPSGKGLHIIGKGKVPRGRRIKLEDGELEVYSAERFFTITGKPYPELVTP
jgi:putative DNA primase/helicase